MARKLNNSRRVDEKMKRRLKRIRRKSEFGFSSDGSGSFGPLGLERMSVVLEDFVKPFWPDTDNIDEVRMLFSLGMTAWNVALAPEQEQEETLDTIMQKINPKNRAGHEEIRAFLKRLILRKKTHFATNRRIIAGFELYDSGHGFQLNVISSVDLPAGR